MIIFRIARRLLSYPRSLLTCSIMATSIAHVEESSSSRNPDVTFHTMFDKDRLRKRTPQLPLILPPIKVSKPRMTAAERSRKSYQKRKQENKEQHKSYLERKKIQSKENREKFKTIATDEDKALKRAQTRERVAKYRQRKKELGLDRMKSDKKPARPTTRQEQEKIDKKREKDKERKRLERQGWSRQKKKAESIKAVERKRSKKVEKVDRMTDEVQKDSTGTDSHRNKKSRQQALYQVEKALPRDQIARKETLDDLFRKNGENKVNPKIRDLIWKCDRRVVRKIIEQIAAMDKPAQNAARKLLTLSKQHLHSLKRSKSFNSQHLRMPKGSADNLKLVLNFLSSNSVVSSEKKYATKLGARMVLNDQINNLFHLFQKEHPHVQISKSFFYKCRPKNMRLGQSVSLNQCLALHVTYYIENLKKTKWGTVTSV